MKALLNTLGVFCLAVGSAQAGLIFTIDNPNQVALDGDTLHFFGTLTNDSATDPLFLNADSFNFQLSAGSYTFNDFLNNLPLCLTAVNTLACTSTGNSTGSVALFDIVLSNPTVDPLGVYLGSLTYIGGATDGAQDNLATGNFSVETVTPEPATGALIGTALLALGVAFRRRTMI